LRTWTPRQLHVPPPGKVGRITAATGRGAQQEKSAAPIIDRGRALPLQRPRATRATAQQ
jgi:hypothetical protein